MVGKRHMEEHLAVLLAMVGKPAGKGTAILLPLAQQTVHTVYLLCRVCRVWVMGRLYRLEAMRRLQMQGGEAVPLLSLLYHLRLYLVMAVGQGQPQDNHRGKGRGRQGVQG